MRLIEARSGPSGAIGAGGGAYVKKGRCLSQASVAVRRARRSPRFRARLLGSSARLKASRGSAIPGGISAWSIRLRGSGAGDVGTGTRSAAVLTHPVINAAARALPSALVTRTAAARGRGRAVAKRLVVCLPALAGVRLVHGNFRGGAHAGAVAFAPRL